MTKALTKRETGVSFNWIVGLAIVGFLIWWFLKNRQVGAYHNAEEWSVTYNSDGLPEKIVISRNAVRG